MPTSTMSQISPIMAVVERIRPARVLDIGVGCGKYGFLCRELLEVYQGGRSALSSIEAFPTDGDAAVIDGIEAYEEYITPLHRLIYNTLFLGDALSVLPGMASSSYDIVLAIDVLEHFPTEAGRRFLGECSRVAPLALIATPKIVCKQGAVHGNDFETHRSCWDRHGLLNEGSRCVLDAEESWLALFGDSPAVDEIAWMHSPRRFVPEFPGKSVLGMLRRALVKQRQE